MANSSDKPSRWERARAVASAATDDFAKLIEIAGLDRRRHLRFADWSGVSFRGCDLRGCDFTGARLLDCDFAGARINGARFDQAEFFFVRSCTEQDDPLSSPLREALDWHSYVSNWKRASEVPVDDHLSVGVIFQDAPFAPAMAVVPAGSFMMGSPDGAGGEQGEVQEPDRMDEEGPRHPVAIAQPFAVGQSAVTGEEWNALVAESGKRKPPSESAWRCYPQNYNITNVTWFDAIAYVEWLSEKSGKQYRLLTEAEWEYCCRAGTVTAFTTGATLDMGRMLNHTNRWGLRGMHCYGDEWCWDGWHDSYVGAPNDGSGWAANPDSGFRVIRGGTLYVSEVGLRSACRGYLHSSKWTKDLGFRVARTLTLGS